MLVCDLDAFRGAEPDSGTIFEIGMGYSRDLILYGHTRDIRSLVWKDQKIVNSAEELLDEHGNKHYYSFLPFSPLVMASTKVIEGDFNDVLNVYESDKYYGHKFGQKYIRKEEIIPKNVFVATRNYYKSELTENEQVGLDDLKAKGYTVFTPYFREYSQLDSIDEWLSELISKNTQIINQCEVFIADLNNYRGYECSNDVAFMAGYAFQEGKKLFAYMENGERMIDKIPNKLKNGKYKDVADRDVEDFDYPINLMFASSMKIVEGDLSDLTQSFD